MIKTSKLLFSSFLVSCLFLTSVTSSMAARPACKSQVSRLKTTANRASSALRRAESGLTRAYNQEFAAFLQGENRLVRPRMNEEINKMAANFFTAQCVLMIIGGNPICKIFNPDYRSLSNPIFDTLTLPPRGKTESEAEFLKRQDSYNKALDKQKNLRENTGSFNREVCTSGKEDCTRKVALFQGQVAALTNQRRALEKSVVRIIEQRKAARVKAEALVAKNAADFDAKQAAYEKAATACDAESFIQECREDFTRACRRDVSSACRSLKGAERTTCVNNGNAKCATDAAAQCKG
jgi:hypothetical protein